MTATIKNFVQEGGEDIMNTKTIAEWMRDKRRKGTIKQGELVTITGLNRTYISRIENGFHRPAYETWSVIARILEPDVSESEIMEVYMASDPENKIRSASEEKLLRAYRKGDITTCIKIIEKRKSEFPPPNGPEVVDMSS